MVDWNINNLWNWDNDNPDAFFAPMWTDRTKDAYSDFFSGGWKEPKNWINPGGVMANPAQQLADPGNFFTSKEHENWLGEGDADVGDVSDRTLASAVVAGLLYGGGSALSGMGGSSAASAGGSTANVGQIGGGSMGAETAGGGGFWENLLSDPNTIQMMGQMGSNFSQGQPTGQAIGDAVVQRSQNQASQRAATQQAMQQQEMLKALIELLQSKEGSKLVGPEDDLSTPDSISIDGGKDKKSGKISLSYTNPSPSDWNFMNLSESPIELQK